MTALVDKVHKKGMSHSDMHSITHTATLFNNHPFISSSGTPVGTKLTATYVGWLLNNVAVLWSAYHCLHDTSCLCTSSASALLHWGIFTLVRFLLRNLFMKIQTLMYCCMFLTRFEKKDRNSMCRWHISWCDGSSWRRSDGGRYSTAVHHKYTHTGQSENIETTSGYNYSYKCLIEKVRLRFEFTDLSLSMRGC